MAHQRQLRRDMQWGNDWRHQFNNELSGGWYITLVIGFIALSLAWTALAAWLTRALTFSSIWSYVIWAVLVFAVAIIGAFITAAAWTTLGSQVGSFIMSFGLGLSFGPVVAHYTPASLVFVLAVTLVITVIFGILGWFLPSLHERWWGPLMAGLLAVIVAVVAVPLFVSWSLLDPRANYVLDFVIIALFCAWTVHDMNRARYMGFTVRNASDVAADIYLNIINQFLSVLDWIGDAVPDFGDGSSDGFVDTVSDILEFIFVDLAWGLLKGIGHVLMCIITLQWLGDD